MKVQGEVVWHRHADTDELFLVVEGELTIQMREGHVVLRPGQLYVVPRGVEHCPRADGEVQAVLMEPAGVVNTGDAGGVHADEELVRAHAAELSALGGAHGIHGLRFASPGRMVGRADPDRDAVDMAVKTAYSGRFTLRLQTSETVRPGMVRMTGQGATRSRWWREALVLSVPSSPPCTATHSHDRRATRLVYRSCAAPGRRRPQARGGVARAVLLVPDAGTGSTTWGPACRSQTSSGTLQHPITSVPPARRSGFTATLSPMGVEGAVARRAPQT